MGKHLNKVTAGGLLIALGIIYGDIGTSPLYVFNSIINGRLVNEALIIGSSLLHHLDNYTSDHYQICNTDLKSR